MCVYGPTISRAAATRRAGHQIPCVPNKFGAISPRPPGAISLVLVATCLPPCCRQPVKPRREHGELDSL